MIDYEYIDDSEQIDSFGYIQSSLMNDSVLRLDDEGLIYDEYEGGYAS